MDKQWLYFPAGYDFRPKWDKIWWKKWKMTSKRTEKNWSRYIWSAFWGLLLCYCFLYLILITRWMSLSISCWSFSIRLSALNCLPFSDFLLIFQEIRRDFQAEAERREFEAELKNIDLIPPNIFMNIHWNIFLKAELKRREKEKAMGVEQQEFGEDDDEICAARGEERKVEKTCTIVY